MWGTSENATVATMPYGGGTVIFMGFDFYNTGAPGPAGGRTDEAACGAYGSDWVQQVLPAALDYASALSSSTVGEVTPTSAEFGYRFGEDGTLHYLLLPADAPAPTTEAIMSQSYARGTERKRV